MSNCSNCGHNCHCGTKCMQIHKDGDGNSVEIECCKNCRCEKVIKSEREAGFNGA